VGFKNVRAADLAGISVEDFVNSLLLETLKQNLRGMKITYSL